MLTQWIEIFLDKSAFASPLAEGPADLVTSFSLALPPPTCETFDAPSNGVARRCKKHQDATFVVPRNKSFENVQLTFDVTIDMDVRGVPLSASVSGPDLFRRLDETYLDHPPLDDDHVRRAAGVERVIAVLTAEFEGRVSAAPTCRRAAQPPDMLHLACEGLTIVATPGAAAGDEDLIWIAAPPESTATAR